jgi:hypothetical protein
MKHLKTYGIAILGIILLSSMGSTMVANAAPGDPPVETNVDSDEFSKNVGAGETHQFRVRNKFQFRLQTNASLELQVGCETDKMGDRSFEMDLETASGQKLTLQFKAGDENLGLKEGNQVKSQNRYRYREMFMVNASLNSSAGVRATLRIATENEGDTWAYYDEDKQEFVPVETKYENGMLVAQTDHFSVWTILEEESTIDGFTLLGLFTIIGIVGLFLKRRK